MRAVIRRNVVGSDVDQAVAARYAGLANGRVRDRAHITVLAFPDAHVVTSADVVRALKRLGETEEPIVVFAGDVTTEANETLRRIGATIFTLRTFGWTDERYRAIRQPKSHDVPRTRREPR